MRIVLSGPPGAGKGTVAEALAAHDGSHRLSTGDLLRAAVAADTPLGRKAKDHMDRGELVPDALILGLVEARLGEVGRQGFILDGFPRTVTQAVALEFMLARLGLALDLVADLAVPTEVITARLTSRRTCTDPACQTIHNLTYNPPVAGDLCRVCGAPVAQRPDETETAIATRLKVYREQSAPVVGHYQRKGLLLIVRESDSLAAATQILANVVAQSRLVTQ